MDVLLAAVGLVATAPLLAACAAAVATTPGPILFRQQRVGQDGRLFWLFKLRTMRPHVGGPQVTTRGDTRITQVGRWLRKSKLDELPQLWNVL